MNPNPYPTQTLQKLSPRQRVSSASPRLSADALIPQTHVHARRPPSPQRSNDALSSSPRLSHVAQPTLTTTTYLILRLRSTLAPSTPSPSQHPETQNKDQ